VIQLQERRGIDQQSEGHAVCFGEAIAGEGLDLPEDRVRQRAGDAVGRGPGVEAVAEAFHLRAGAFGAHGAAELVGFGCGEVGDVDGHLHDLFLEQRHTESAAEGTGEFGVGVGPGFAVAAADVGVDRAALDRAGSDEGDFDDEIVELAWPKPGECGELGAGFHLEHSDRVRGAQHVVHGRVGEVEFGDVPSAVHFRSRSCAVFHGPYRSGRSRHGAPVRSFHRIASISCRWLRHRPPRRPL
jgi:hypothetical protein